MAVSMEQIFEDEGVKVPTVHPWAYFPTCAKCRASLGAGIPVLRWILAWNGRDAQNFGWCKGDHNSTITMHANLGGMEIGKAELPVECFGIFTEHLHVNCRRCGHRWLMECAPPSRPDSFWRDFRGFAKWFFIVLGVGFFVFLLIASLIGY